MAECVEGPVAAEEKQINSEAPEMDVQTAGELSAVSEVTTESEAVIVSEDKLETDAVCMPEKADDITVAKAEEKSLPEESNVPETLNDKDEAVSEMSIVHVATEVDHVPEESKEEAAEQSLQSSSKKRKSEDDKETSGEEVKKLKTEETPAVDEAVKSNDDAPVDDSTPTETAVMDIVANETENTPTETAAMDIVANETESTPAVTAVMDIATNETEGTPAETATMDIVTNETEAIPAESIIPEDLASKSSKEGNTEAPMEKEEAKVVSDQQEDKDLSENKENVIEETISNGTTEKDATKTVESVDEEAIKVPAVKALDETEQPKEAEAVSS